MLKNYEGSGFKEFRTSIIEILITAGEILNKGQSFSFSLMISFKTIQLVDPEEGKGWVYKRKK